MNDFTKEELYQILSSMNETRNSLGHDDELIDKIESRIDRYCEHEPNYDTLTLRDEKLGILNYYDRCKKCGKFLDDNQ